MATGRLAGTGIKLKGKLTLEFDKDVDLFQLLPLLGGTLPGQDQARIQVRSNTPESLLPLFPQPYLSNQPQSAEGMDKTRSRKFNYRSPDFYPVSGSLINKGEASTIY